MFQYLLAFLLINSYYQSLGTPVHPVGLISESLDEIAVQCKNELLSTAIKEKITECAVSAPPYEPKQIRCLIFYDINKQLCSAAAASKILLANDYKAKIDESQDTHTVCTLAKDWIFTNLTEYVNYKNLSEAIFKSPTICGLFCGAEKSMTEANEFCKYFRWGMETLNRQVSTASVVNNNVASEIVAPEQNPNLKAEADIPINVNLPSPQAGNIQTKQAELAVGKSTTGVGVKTEESGNPGIQKSTVQSTSSNKPVSQENAPSAEKNDDDLNVNAMEHQIDLPEVGNNDQANKSTVTNQSKLEVENDPALLPEPGKDLSPNIDTKGAVLEKAEGKPAVDSDDYPESEGNDGIDDEVDEPRMDMKPDSEAKQDTFKRPKIVQSHMDDISHKEYHPIPMTDGFSDDGDHFFPFFLTAIILVILLYVLYHNKSKVSKVFFGLILEGRQGRRRNSRGHAYRRLDTLEQAMSANTAAPPSKIIY